MIRYWQKLYIHQRLIQIKVLITYQQKRKGNDYKKLKNPKVITEYSQIMVMSMKIWKTIIQQRIWWYDKFAERYDEKSSIFHIFTLKSWSQWMWLVSCRRQGMLTQGPAPDPKCELNITSFLTLPHPLHYPICAKDIKATVLLLQVVGRWEGWTGSFMFLFCFLCLWSS